MTTLNTTDDLLRAARENREFREAFRREILTEELIELPTLVRESSRETNAKLDGIAELVAENSRNIAENSRNIAANSEDIKTLVASVAELTKGMKGMREDIRQIDEAHRIEHLEMHRFRGNYGIEGTRNRARQIIRLFTSQRGVSRFEVKLLSESDCEKILDDLEDNDAIDQLGTEGNILETFSEGDIIAKVSYRRSGDTIFYIAVEASYTVHPDDVIRASDHAKILREATGQEAIAIVSGVNVKSDMEEIYRERIIVDEKEYMESDRDDMVYWYRLSDSSLEPTSPR